MEGDRERGRRPGEWNPQEWPDSDWEREEDQSAARAPGYDERAGAPRDRYRSAREIRSDIGNVMDDPLYDGPAGGRAGQDRSPISHRGYAERARPAQGRAALSAGHKLLLWVGVAVVSAVSFGAGLIVGAGGGLDVPAIPFLGTKTEEVSDPGELDALGPPPEPEGVIQFGTRGKVPSADGAEGPVLKAGNGEGDAAEKVGAVPASEKPAGKGAGKPVKAAAAAPAGKKAPEAEPKAVAEPEPVAKSTATKQTKEPAPAEPEKAPAEEPPSEMTFYETATGESAMPGLTGLAAVDEEIEDAEAPPEPEGEPEAAPPAPSGAALLADLKPGKPQPPAADAQPDSLVDETPSAAPSGAEVLARRQAVGGGTPSSTPPAPLPSTAVSGDSYTVQVTTLADESQAERLAGRLRSKGFDARIVPLSRSGIGTLYRIRVGHYPTEAAARADLDRLSSEPGAHPYIRME